MKKCGYCGRENNGDVVHCRGCGTEFESQRSGNSPRPLPQQTYTSVSANGQHVTKGGLYRTPDDLIAAVASGQHFVGVLPCWTKEASRRTPLAWKSLFWIFGILVFVCFLIWSKFGPWIACIVGALTFLVSCLYSMKQWLNGIRQKPDALVITSSHVCLVSGVKLQLPQRLYGCDQVLAIPRKNVIPETVKIAEDQLKLKTTDGWEIALKPSGFLMSLAHKSVRFYTRHVLSCREAQNVLANRCGPV